MLSAVQVRSEVQRAVAQLKHEISSMLEAAFSRTYDQRLAFRQAFEQE